MTKYVYTLSSREVMFEHAFLSIRTLSRYIDVSDIIVFFTPPVDEMHLEKLRGLGVDVRERENRTEEFVAFDRPQNYGEKTWVEKVDDSEVVFLDCDTFVLGDITEVLQGDFEFKAREEEDVLQPEWRQMFERFGEEYMNWMPNAGFLVFKDDLHKRIGEKWRKYIQTDLGYRHKFNHKEQYALALAVGGSETVKMDSSEHAMFWKDEFPPDGIVYHTAKELENYDSDEEQDMKSSEEADSGLTDFLRKRI